MSRRIYAKKSLGQNFLIDKRVKTKIVKNLYLNDKDIVVEIGPGKGALTEIIYNKVNKLVAVEYDDYLYDVKWVFSHVLFGLCSYNGNSSKLYQTIDLVDSTENN